MKRDFPKDRPPPLKISRPSDPHHQHHHQQQQQQQQQQEQPLRPHYADPSRPPGNPNPRQPVIIHTYSPEVIQIDSNNFRQLVQRLTGPGSHAPPPPKRSRVAAPPPSGNFNPNYNVPPQAHGHASQAGQMALHSALSPRGLRLQQEAPHPYVESSTSYGNLPPNPLLSPSLFDFSPSVLPSPSTFSFDFPSMVSPMGMRGSSAGLLPSPHAPGGSSVPGLPSPLGHGGAPTPRSLAAGLSSPGPLSSTFLADLPVLSPAAYSWIEKNTASADAILLSRPMISAGLPPRPPPTTTANLFPHHQGTPEDEKPLYREK